MRKIDTLLKLLFAILFSFSLGHSQLIMGQTIFVSAPPNYPPAKNIGPGSSDNIIAMFQAYTSSPTTLNSISLPTTGSFVTTDFTGFKLWYRSNFVSGNPIIGATMVGQTGPISNGSSIVITGITVSLTSNSPGVFYVTVDVASSATLGNTIQVTQTPGTNLVFSSGSASGSNLSDMNIQTIGTPLPTVSVQGFASTDMNVSAGFLEANLYGFDLSVDYADATLTSLSVPTFGTYTTSDIAANGFKLWYSSNGSKELIQSASAVASGGTLVFSGFSKVLPKDFNHHLFITADLSNIAAAGHTFGLGSFPLTNFGFSQLQSISGTDPIQQSGTFTIAVPTIPVSSLLVLSSSVSPGSFNNVVYKLKITAQNSTAVFSQIKFTTAGTYQSSDIANLGFKLYSGDASNLYPQNLIASINSVSSGGSLIFNLPNTSLNQNEDFYLYLTADIASAATASKTISISSFSPANLTAISGSVTGSGVASGIKTIVVPSVSFSSAGPSASTLAMGANAVLHSVKISVSGAPATFSGASYSLNGTFQPTDFSGDKIYLMYHKTSNLVQEMSISDSVFVISSVDLIPSSGGTLTFNFKPLNIDVNPTIPSGNGYISVLVKVGSSAVSGHTIQLTTAGLSAITFASGTTSGTIGDAGIQTIGTSSVTATGIPVAASNITPGSIVPIYEVRLDITNTSAILQSASFSTAGTYNTGDISNYYLYSSDDPYLNMDNDFNLGAAASVASGSSINFTSINNKELTVGTKYLFLVAVTSFAQSVGNTIYITATSPSNLVFISGAAIGSTMNAGGVQTFAVPTSINLSIPPVAGTQLQASSQDNLIYQFTITPSGSNAILLYVNFPTSGTFVDSDLSSIDAFKLYYNTTNSFPGSTLLATTNTINSGDVISFNSGVNIPQDATGYFYLTVDVSSAPIAQHTLRIESFSGSNVIFSSGVATGSAPASELFTLVTTITSIKPSMLNSGFNLYPNPTRTGEVVKIDDKSQGTKVVSIYNSIGDLVKVEEIKEGTLLLEGLDKGLYVIFVSNTQTGTIQNAKLLIE